MAASMSFNVLIKKDGETWIAHCLELDIVATAETAEKANDEIIDLIMTQLDYALANDNMQYFYKPAPQEVWLEFFNCRKGGKIVRKFKGIFEKKGPKPSQIVTNTCSSEPLCYA